MIGVSKDYNFIILTDSRYYEEQVTIYPIQYSGLIGRKCKDQYPAQHNFIDAIMVVGENQKFCAALVSPDFLFLKNWAKLHDIEYTTNEEMIKHPRVRSRIGEEIKKYNAQFGDTEKIKKFDIVPEEWSQKNGLLTPTLKVKRNKAIEYYKENIDKLFA